MVTKPTPGADADEWGHILNTALDDLDDRVNQRIPSTVLQTKGDMVAATGPGTAGRVAPGTAGSLLSVDSSTATGLSWQPNYGIRRYANSPARDAALPAPDEGTVVWVQSWRRLFVYNNGGWQIVWQWPSDDWTSVTLLNGWTNYPTAPLNTPAGYRKLSNGMVMLRGLLDSGTGSSAQTMFVLPTGFRPAYSTIFSVWTSGTAAIRLDVQADGAVKPMTATTVGTDVSLAGVSFFADA
jgi:hypothetical protein